MIKRQPENENLPFQAAHYHLSRSSPANIPAQAKILVGFKQQLVLTIISEYPAYAGMTAVMIFQAAFV